MIANEDWPFSGAHGLQWDSRFAKSEIVDFMERAGMRFGSHVNAYTSHNETVYMLQLPTDDPSLLDTGFNILEDWATAITLDPLEIEKEGVILEEWRQRQGVGERLNEKQLPFIYYKSDYADRKPIGSMIVVRNVRERFEEFYKQWYRPNLMGVIVVGDIDRDEIEEGSWIFSVTSRIWRQLWREPLLLCRIMKRPCIR